MYDKNWIKNIIVKHQPYMQLRHGIRKSNPTKKFLKRLEHKSILKSVKRKQQSELKKKKIYFIQNKGIFLSKGEKMLRECINELFPKDYTILNDRGTLPMLELDVHLPQRKIAFEFNGMQHYEFVPCFHNSIIDFKEQQKRDELKRYYCKLYKIQLIEIPYWNYTKELIKSYFLNIMKPKRDNPN